MTAPRSLQHARRVEDDWSREGYLGHMAQAEKQLAVIGGGVVGQPVLQDGEDARGAPSSEARWQGQAGSVESLQGLIRLSCHIHQAVVQRHQARSGLHEGCVVCLPRLEALQQALPAAEFPTPGNEHRAQSLRAHWESRMGLPCMSALPQPRCSLSCSSPCWHSQLLDCMQGDFRMINPQKLAQIL